MNPSAPPPGESPLPVVPVVAAVMVEGERALVTRRLPGDRFPLLWEFPGGKVETGETHPEALVREILEELGIEVEVGGLYDRIAYPSDRGVILEIFFYLARRTGGDPRPLEVSEWVWAEPGNLRDLDFIPSNREVADRLAADLETSADLETNQGPRFPREP